MMHEFASRFKKIFSFLTIFLVALIPVQFSISFDPVEAVDSDIIGTEITEMRFFDIESDEFDPCPNVDSDSDHVLDCEDNCIFTYNPHQEDSDFNFIGDKCDAAYGTMCDSYRTQFDTDGDGVSEYCLMGSAGMLHRAVKLLETLEIEDSEHEEIIEAIKESTILSIPGDPDSPYLLFPTAYEISYRDNDYLHFFDKIGEAVDDLETYGPDFDVEDEYEIIIELLLNASRQLVTFKENQINFIQDSPTAIFELSDPALDLVFKDELQQMSNERESGDEDYDDAEYESAIDHYKEAYGHLVAAYTIPFDEKTTTVGSSGGIVKSIDGLFELEIPADALTEDTIFTVQLMKGEDVMWDLDNNGRTGSPSYYVEPQVDFLQPATLTLVSPLAITNGEFETSFGTFDYEYFIHSSNPETMEVYESIETEIEDDKLATVTLDSIYEGILTAAFKILLVSDPPDDPGQISPSYGGVEWQGGLSGGSGGGSGGGSAPGDGDEAGILKVFTSDPNIKYINGSVVPTPVGIQGCKDYYNFEEGLKWCGLITDIEGGHADISGWGELVTVSQEGLLKNRIGLVPIPDPDIYATISLVTGVLGAGLVIVDVIWGSKASGVKLLLLRAGQGCTTTGCAASTIALIIKPSRMSYCKNFIKEDRDCNRGDRCQIVGDSMGARDGYCDNTNGSSYNKWLPMPTPGDARCRDEKVYANCNSLEGPLCTNWDSESSSCRHRTTYRGTWRQALADNPPACEEEEDDEDRLDIDINHWNCVHDPDYSSGIELRTSSYVSYRQTCGGGIIRSYSKTCETIWDWVHYATHIDGYGNSTGYNGSKPHYDMQSYSYLVSDCNFDDETCWDGYCGIPDDNPNGCYACKSRRSDTWTEDCEDPT